MLPCGEHRDTSVKRTCALCVPQTRALRIDRACERDSATPPRDYSSQVSHPRNSPAAWDSDGIFAVREDLIKNAALSLPALAFAAFEIFSLNAE